MAIDDPKQTKNLAEQAMSNLVNQFARPMDFLRELVQNAIDAGTPRIEVYLTWTPSESGDNGVLEIHLDDFGEGMDKQIIDNQLTRLFSSTKEDDLTKIGKFGIGFTSIFAIRPDLVRLLTGRHGEFWEIVFHPDRSFETRHYPTSVNGTQITLFKRMSTEEMERTVHEARFILTYWCEHSNVPISFSDRTADAKTGKAEANARELDPFAAFMHEESGHSGVEVEAINSPMGLPAADIRVAVEQDNISVVIGYADSQRYGFYHSGLTLISSEQTDILGTHAHAIGHVSFKVRSNALEHTLTRDNVLQDANWDAAMAVVSKGATMLRASLLDELETASPEHAQVLLRHLVREAQLAKDLGTDCAWWEAHRMVLRDHTGKPVSMVQIEKQHATLDVVLLDPGPGPLRDALVEQNLLLLPNSPDTADALRAWPNANFLGFTGTAFQVITADKLFIFPELCDTLALPNDERNLLAATQALLDKSTGRIQLKLGNFGGLTTTFSLEGPKDAVLFRRPVQGAIQMPSFLRWRTLLINRSHPHYQAQLVAAGESTLLAAFALAQALLVTENAVSRSTHTNLLAAAHE